jgi:hypothetical protein
VKLTINRKGKSREARGERGSRNKNEKEEEECGVQISPHD